MIYGVNSLHGNWFPEMVQLSFSPFRELETTKEEKKKLIDDIMKSDYRYVIRMTLWKTHKMTLYPVFAIPNMLHYILGRLGNWWFNDMYL